MKRATSVVLCLFLQVFGAFPAPAQESRILDAVREWGGDSPIMLALPPQPSQAAGGNAAALPPGPAGAPQAGFFDRITDAQERNVVDKAYPLMAAKWPFNAVFVCWENPAPGDLGDRLLVQESIRTTWEDVSGLRFIGWSQCTAASRGIRITIRDEGPHVKFLGKFVDGVPDGMVLNFTYRNWGTACAEMRDYCNRAIAVHEFGHAIGFAHEQNRPDTPGECDMAPQGTSGDNTLLTPWDPHSVMNYCNPAYNNDGALSEFDILAVRYIYGDRG